MTKGSGRFALSYVPGLKNNAVLQLILAIGVAYCLLAISWAIIMIVDNGKDLVYNAYFMPNISLTALPVLKTHLWTILIYGWFHSHESFMELISNMIWLYSFGSVIQMMVGYKQVIPLFIYTLVIGGVFYALAQLIPTTIGVGAPQYLGPRAGVMGFAIASITLSPKYRFYFTEHFHVPLAVIVGFYVLISILGSHLALPDLSLLLGGGLMGFAYIKLLQSGFRPGNWMYAIYEYMDNSFTPKEKKVVGRGYTQAFTPSYATTQPKTTITQRLIDEILDKINQKGYDALSKEEKEILLKAGKEQ